MRAPNRTCCVCGKKYFYCTSCPETADLAPWHFVFHDESCKNAFEICRDYNLHKYTKAQAKSRLNKLSIDNYKSFIDTDIVFTIDEILDVKVSDNDSGDEEVE